VSGAPDPAAPTVDAADLESIWRVTHVVPDDLPPPPAQGPLAGARLAVKDLFAVAGQRIGAGNPSWLLHAPVEERTASAVAALVGAGCLIEGLAHTDELALSLAGKNVHYGTPPNPAAPGRIPGGSTSGPASAVAAHLADVALGTDTGGSVRVPASYCGLYGLRTTHDAVARDGLVGLAPSFDTVGVLTRDARTLLTAADQLLPPQAGTPWAGPVELVLVPALLDLVPEDVREATLAAATALAVRTSGTLVVQDVVRRQDVEDLFTAFRTVQAAQAWQLHGRFVEGADVDPVIAGRFQGGRAAAADAPGLAAAR
ncbi:amidase family protein, partial [Cellulomonas bogoriensis]|uniref:amidase family protein n=1 Tax=Cellulomonas bogoriensis TaxID=301388 RepID=UPI0018DB571E